MPTKVKELRAPVESGSMSDVVLHFLFMFSKTNAYGNPTSVELYQLNSARYKKKDNLERALSRLIKMKLITFYIDSGNKRYKITDLGKSAVQKLAMFRRRTRVIKGMKDDD